MGKTDTLLIFSITILSMLVIGLVIYDQTTDTETNQVKFKYFGEVHVSESKLTSIQDLKKNAKDLYGAEIGTTFTLQYQDKSNTWITLSKDQDLKFFIDSDATTIEIKNALTDKLKLPNKTQLNGMSSNQMWSIPDPSKILAKLKKLMKQVEEIAKQAVVDKKETTALKKAVKKQAAQIASILDQLSYLSGKEEIYVKKTDDLKKIVDKVSSQMKQLTGSKSTTKTTLSTLSTKIEKLTKEQKGFTTQLKDLDSDKVKHERQILFLSNQINDTVTRQNNLTAKFQAQSTNDDQQSKKLSTLQAQVSQIVATQKGQTKKLDDLQNNTQDQYATTIKSLQTSMNSWNNSTLSQFKNKIMVEPVDFKNYTATKTILDGKNYLTIKDLGQATQDGAGKGVYVTAIYLYGSDKNILKGLPALKTTSMYQNSCYSYALGCDKDVFNEVGGYNWFKNNGIDLVPPAGTGGTQALGGLIKFSDGTIGVIDMWSNGKKQVGLTQGAQISYQTYAYLNEAVKITVSNFQETILILK